MTFGERLSALREKKGLTQIELADLTKISRSRLSLYEIDKREPDLETVKQLANFFDVSTDYLLGRDMKPTEKSRYHTPDQATDDPELQKRFAERAEYYKVADEAADAKIPPDKIRKFLELFKDSNDK